LGGRIEQRVEPQAPNQLWTVDFKGWWYTLEKQRVEPLTVRDAFSRYVLCAQILADGRTETVRTVFERLFETYGLPEAIRSDNGSPFASVNAALGLSRLSAWWVALGINLDRIQPGHPEQNGGHERMHRDIALEVEGSMAGDVTAQQAALEIWRQEHNAERPHEALGMRMPSEVYVKSARRYDGSPVELTYPRDHVTRRVSGNGQIRVGSRRIKISAALAGWNVGLKPIGRQCFAVWFGGLCLGQLDLETESFQPMDALRPRGVEPGPGGEAVRERA
jgi:hypothetical protein